MEVREPLIPSQRHQMLIVFAVCFPNRGRPYHPVFRNNLCTCGRRDALVRIQPPEPCAVTGACRKHTHRNFAAVYVVVEHPACVVLEADLLPNVFRGKFSQACVERTGRRVHCLLCHAAHHHRQHLRIHAHVLAKLARLPLCSHRFHEVVHRPSERLIARIMRFNSENGLKYCSLNRTPLLIWSICSTVASLYPSIQERNG